MYCRVSGGDRREEKDRVRPIQIFELDSHTRSRRVFYISESQHCIVSARPYLEHWTTESHVSTWSPKGVNLCPLHEF